MKRETYFKNKQIFYKNYKSVYPKFKPLNTPIELCMTGIHGKQKFFEYFSYDTKAVGTNVVWSCNSYKIYRTWDNKSMSRIMHNDSKTSRLFKEGEFERFDKYMKSRDKI